jgi:hypothetical protein
MSLVLLASCLALSFAGCGTGESSMSDYADQVEQLVTTMNTKIDTSEAQSEAQGFTLEATRQFWETKVEARSEFIAGLGEIDPPDDAEEMHTAALSIVGRLKAADEAVTDLLRSMTTEQEMGLLTQSPEYLATEAVDEEAVALCQAVQAEFDSTYDREVFGDSPWVPSELREVVSVAFGCTKEERGITP